MDLPGTPTVWVDDSGEMGLEAPHEGLGQEEVDGAWTDVPWSLIAPG